LCRQSGTVTGKQTDTQTDRQTDTWTEGKQYLLRSAGNNKLK